MTNTIKKAITMATILFTFTACGTPELGSTMEMDGNTYIYVGQDNGGYERVTNITYHCMDEAVEVARYQSGLITKAELDTRLANMHKEAK